MTRFDVSADITGVHKALNGVDVMKRGCKCGPFIFVAVTACLACDTITILFAIASFTLITMMDISQRKNNHHNNYHSFGKFIDPCPDKLLKSEYNVHSFCGGYNNRVVAGGICTYADYDMAGYDCGWTAYENACQKHASGGRWFSAFLGMMGKAKLFCRCYTIIFLLLNNLKTYVCFCDHFLFID